MTVLRDVAQDLAVILEGAGLSLVRGTNLFHGPVPGDDTGDTIPASSVFLLATGGPSPENLVGSRRVIQTVNVQVRVRGDRESFPETLALAGSVYAALHLASTSTYSIVEVKEPTPVYGGPDAEGRTVFILNAAATYQAQF